MKLKEIVAISGISGLHKIIGRTKSGLILETLDTKKRFPTSIQDKVSVLEDISMYTEDGDLALAEVFVKLNENGKAPTSKDDSKAQRKYLVDTIKLDSERVYDSDIKKLLNWFHALKDLLDFSTLLETEESAENAEEAPVAEEAAPKKAAKKTAKKASEETSEEPAPKKAAAKKAAAPKKTAPKTATPKAAKVSNKSASNANTYRPKSV